MVILQVNKKYTILIIRIIPFNKYSNLLIDNFLFLIHSKSMKKVFQCLRIIYKKVLNIKL
jgi:hypothetical protein